MSDVHSAGFDPAAPGFREDPYIAYRWLREHEPVHRDPNGELVLTRYADVQAVLRDPAWGSAHSRSPTRQLWRGESGAPAAVDELFSKVLPFMDPPAHTRLRNLVVGAFTPRHVEELRPRIEAVLAEFLESMGEAGEIDVISEFAFPFPVTVICELLGIPASDRSMFREQTEHLGTILEWEVSAEQFADAATAAIAFAGYLLPLFNERRRSPRDDLISALVSAEVDGDRLSDDELYTTVVLLLAAGHESTANLIGNGLLALLRHPDQLSRLRDEPRLARAAVEELLRYDCPLQFTARTALEDTEIGGTRVHAGEQVVALLGAANRDPAVFSNPDRLDITRSPNNHLGFSAGHHFCLGATLARVEAQLAFTALTSLRGLELMTDTPEWRDTVVLRALARLPVRYSRRT